MCFDWGAIIYRCALIGVPYRCALIGVSYRCALIRVSYRCALIGGALIGVCFDWGVSYRGV